MSPTSHYFENFSARKNSEMLLMEDIINESIQIMGHDIQYIPREVFSESDYIFGENVISKFNRAYTIEAYISNVEGFEGDSDFFSKFGLEIRNTSNFVVARRAFEKYVPSSIATRPREGDLIYVPLMKKLFEIKFVEHQLMFYSLGNRNPYVYELRVEQFRSSQEDFNTGVSDIDELMKQTSYTIQLNVINGTGEYNINETVYQGANLSVATVTAMVKDWSSVTKKLDVINIKGVFATSANVIGVTSNTRYSVTSIDSMSDHIDYDQRDNQLFDSQGNNFIQITSNPFGEP